MPQGYQSLEDGKSVIVYDPTDSNLTSEFCKDLQRRINGWYRQLTVKREVGDLGMPCVVPVIIICHNHSRIGTDIDSAMSRLKDSDQSKSYFAIVVVHAKERHALPVTMPTVGLFDEKYEQYGLLVDYAFTPDNRIYTCDMNSKADNKLQPFLQKQLKLGPSSRTSSPHRSANNNDNRQRMIIAGCIVGGIVILGIVLLAVYA